MDLFDWLSLISFALGSYLSITKIIESFPKLEIEVLNSYKALDIVYLKVSIYNKSSNPVVISKTNLSNRSRNLNFQSTSYKHTIMKFNDGRKLHSSGLPINLLPKNADSLFLAFPVGDHLEELIDGKLELSIKVNGRFYPVCFDFTSTYSQETQLLKES
ncbi:hypothetical protein HCG83_13250 [Enterococcus casseliflavus]|uniref:hypothetical protein n=1 Tax=Enterococcus casseliflavus TaxID=37734 RepID=UPI001C8CC677|nr:hypothetical protein [Enterococcus casseliflavus]MBX9117271.1 hypothetical protein [Enterococcus casseliflavus]MBX9127737.1 hypothetical protein [Enterococcus casseliflavus]